ncbi:MAG: hypothetical protein Q4E29_00300 [Lachnospiraceae bacterium]|nr:hypothetical protein [Lachnospiraceae bacterium]
MTSLLVAKQYIKNFVSKYEVYLKPIGKLILALVTLMTINGKIGFMQKIDNISVVLIAALMCSFMPTNFIIVVAALFVLLHLYALSIECAAIGLVLFLVLFLLYFRFTPKDTLAVVLTPICTAMGIPYVVPLTMGLLGTPASVVSVACGVIVSSFIKNMSDSATAISSMETEDMAAKFRFVIDGLINNKEMILMIVAFSVTIILVYFVKRLAIDYAWTIAIAAGALADMMILLVGDLVFDTNGSIVMLIIGTIISVLVAKVVEFFAFSVDYSRTEKVQFEDDEYYYYVKAIPKINVATPSRTVKKINSHKRKPSSSQSRR